LKGSDHFPSEMENIVKVIAFLHRADGVDWQSPPKGTSLNTLKETEQEGFILTRGEFQKRQFRLTDLGLDYLARDRRRLEARKL
jgi:DNA-binding PadR family transcriptional regulator